MLHGTPDCHAVLQCGRCQAILEVEAVRQPRLAEKASHGRRLGRYNAVDGLPALKMRNKPGSAGDGGDRRVARRHGVKKAEVLELLHEMPDDLDPEDLMYRLFLKTKVAEAEDAIQRGDLISHADVIRLTEEWLR